MDWLTALIDRMHARMRAQRSPEEIRRALEKCDREAMQRMDGPGRMQETDIDDIESLWDASYTDEEVNTWAHNSANWLIREVRYLRAEVARLRART